METRNFHLAANSRNEHEEPGVRIFKIKEQHNTSVRSRVSMHEPVFSQIRYERVLHLHATPDGFRYDDVQHSHQMRHLFWFGNAHECDVASKLLKKIIDRQFVICRMQHPLTQHTKVMRKILRGAIHACYGTRKTFPV